MSGGIGLWLGVYRLRPDLRDPAAWSEADTAAGAAHFERLKAEAAAGRVMLAGRTDDTDAAGWLSEGTLGLVIFEAGTRAEAEAFVGEDPAVTGGIMTCIVQSYRLAVVRDTRA
ncbi:YciI family protein [Breoghania sp. L-A4]|uniref:YciI family protein n=1 Tax=Breoghania sp. L-A4 TaxID=2304600 RepID=UPI000E35D459|nr:YciI family protein [Breoghania sp. L-A4]AXS39661.1 hypothetical protein D1F64_05855 [Breoghania sp. L-A4]